MAKEALLVEWKILQNQFDSYEKHSLIIKLTAVVVTLAAMIASVHYWVTAALIIVLWLQDGIWKTFQSRFEPRLLELEKALEQDGTKPGCQFNTQYDLTRQRGVGLIVEYAVSACRPTVAFPFVPLLLVSIFL